MSSQRRIDASRRNGALSKGPKTEAGKRRSSMNALRHGILAERVILSNESEENFQLVLDDYMEKYKPRDGVELGMVEQMSSCFWRLQRAVAIEKRLFDQALENHPNGPELNRDGDAWNDLATTATSLQTMLRYQVMLDRMEARTQRKLFLARKLEQENQELPNEPSPNSGHPDPPPPLPTPDPEEVPDPRTSRPPADVHVGLPEAGTMPARLVAPLIRAVILAMVCLIAAVAQHPSPTKARGRFAARRCLPVVKPPCEVRITCDSVYNTLETFECSNTTPRGIVRE
jgi:hypothetical protein